MGFLPFKKPGFKGEAARFKRTGTAKGAGSRRDPATGKLTPRDEEDEVKPTPSAVVPKKESAAEKYVRLLRTGGSVEAQRYVSSLEKEREERLKPSAPTPLPSQIPSPELAPEPTIRREPPEPTPIKKGFEPSPMSEIREYKPSGIRGVAWWLRGFGREPTYAEGGKRRALPIAEKISGKYMEAWEATIGKFIFPITKKLKEPFETKLEAEFKGVERRRETAEQRLKEFAKVYETKPARETEAYAERIMPIYQKKIEEGAKFEDVQAAFEKSVKERYEKKVKFATEGFDVLQKEAIARYEEEKQVKTVLPTSMVYEKLPGIDTKQLKPSALSFILGTGLEEGAKFVLPHPYISPRAVEYGLKGLALVSEPPTKEEWKEFGLDISKSYKFSPELFIGTALATAVVAGGISKLTKPTRIKIGRKVKGFVEPKVTDARLKAMVNPMASIIKRKRLTIKVKKPFAPRDTMLYDIHFRPKAKGITARPLREIITEAKGRVEVIPKQFPLVGKRPIPKLQERLIIKGLFAQRDITGRARPLISFDKMIKRMTTATGFKIVRGKEILFEVIRPTPIIKPRPKPMMKKPRVFLKKEITDPFGRVQIQLQELKLKTVLKQKLKQKQKLVILQKVTQKQKQKLGLITVSALKTAQLQRQIMGQMQMQSQLQKQKKKQRQLQALKSAQLSAQSLAQMMGQLKAQRQKRTQALLPAQISAQAQKMGDVDLHFLGFEEPVLEKKRFIPFPFPETYYPKKKKKERKRLTRLFKYQHSIVGKYQRKRRKKGKILTGFSIRGVEDIIFGKKKKKKGRR